MIVAVTVGVALRRPPRLDELRRVLVEADTEVEAELIAVQISSCTAVMAVCSEVTEIWRSRLPTLHRPDPYGGRACGVSTDAPNYERTNMPYLEEINNSSAQGSVRRASARVPGALRTLRLRPGRNGLG